MFPTPLLCTFMQVQGGVFHVHIQVLPSSPITNTSPLVSFEGNSQASTGAVAWLFKCQQAAGLRDGNVGEIMRCVVGSRDSLGKHEDGVGPKMRALQRTHGSIVLRGASSPMCFIRCPQFPTLGNARLERATMISRHGCLELQLLPSLVNQTWLDWNPIRMEEKFFLQVVPLLLWVKPKRLCTHPRASGIRVAVMSGTRISSHNSLANSPPLFFASVWREAPKDADA